MTERLLLPLRVPELGPALGRLPRRPDPADPDEWAHAYRLRLVTRLLEAAGEARRRAAAGERDAAFAALGAPVWLDAWEEAVAGVADRVMDDVATALDAAGWRRRMSRRRRARLAPTDAERRGVAARFGAVGAPLVSALDRLEQAGAGARQATARERDAMDAWREALAGAARRLEASWDALLAAAAAERTQWQRDIDTTARWRPPLWRVAALGLPLLAAALWLGLVFGGYVAPPAWLTRAWRALPL